MKAIPVHHPKLLELWVLAVVVVVRQVVRQAVVLAVPQAAEVTWVVAMRQETGPVRLPEACRAFG